MKLFLPDNIFAHILADNLPDNLKWDVKYLPSSSIPAELKKDSDAAGLITPTDILSSGELYISSKLGISFEGILSNSYIYFAQNQKEFKSLALLGDVSSLEVILSRIFFKENYNSDIEVELLTDPLKAEGKNVLVTGDLNLTSGIFSKGLSFAEEMTDMLSLPYVNFITASMQSDSLEKINKSCAGISDRIYDLVDDKKFGSNFPAEAKEYIKENIAGIIYEFESQDIDDIHQLIRLPYFHGIIDDIPEPKFI